MDQALNTCLLFCAFFCNSTIVRCNIENCKQKMSLACRVSEVWVVTESMLFCRCHLIYRVVPRLNPDWLRVPPSLSVHVYTMQR